MCLKGSSVTWALQKNITKSCRGPTKLHKETKKLISFNLNPFLLLNLMQKNYGCYYMSQTASLFSNNPQSWVRHSLPVKCSFTNTCQVGAVYESWGLAGIINSTNTQAHTCRAIFTVLSSTSTHQLYITNTAGEYIPACLHTPEGGICFSSQAPGHCEPWQLLPQ